MGDNILLVLVIAVVALAVGVLMMERRHKRYRKPMSIKDVKLPTEPRPIPRFDLTIKPDWIKCVLEIEHGTYETRITAMKFAFFTASGEQVYSDEPIYWATRAHTLALTALLDQSGFQEVGRTTRDVVWEIVTYERR